MTQQCSVGVGSTAASSVANRAKHELERAPHAEPKRLLQKKRKSLAQMPLKRWKRAQREQEVATDNADKAQEMEVAC